MNAWCSITHKEEETIHCSWIIHTKMNFLYFLPSELLCNPTTFSSLLIFVTACCKKLWCTLSLRENTHVLSYPWPDYTLSPGFLRSSTDVRRTPKDILTPYLTCTVYTNEFPRIVLERWTCGSGTEKRPKRRQHGNSLSACQKHPWGAWTARLNRTADDAHLTPTFSTWGTCF